MFTTIQTNTSTSTSTTSPQETKPDAAELWVTTIQALEAYQRECDLSDALDRESAQQDG